jgi:succinyl-CoA synthetase beta subunit
MNIHEYQAKEILRKYGVPVPEGHVIYNSNSARDWAKRLGGGVCVVKAQIHAGGRGKGGGVKIAKTPDEVKQLAREILGMTLVTHQTGPEGKHVKRVLVEQGCNIADEFYVSLLVDRGTSKVTLMASAEGGMDIEEVAAKTPEKLFFEPIDPLAGLTPFQARKVAFKLGQAGGAAADEPVQSVRRVGLLAARDQSPGADQGREAAVHRRQAQFR